MKFADLHKTIPYVNGGKSKVLSMNPYPGITLAMPGRHAKDTIPLGGDFVVMVTDAGMGWDNHQFTHTDLFKDLSARADHPYWSDMVLMENYLDVITGADPNKFTDNFVPVSLAKGDRPVVHPLTFLHAVQCLAVAEHRRYSQHEAKFGGRYLPFRFSAGIVEGLWTDTDAADKQKYGRPGVQQLEREKGTPLLTKKLMGTDDT